MSRQSSNRNWLLVLFGLAIAGLVFLFGKWRDANMTGGQLPAEPFRIAGNLYYVGANDATSFLITSPQGHVLIDGGPPAGAAMIMASMSRLGFNIRDVKVLLNSESYDDLAGGLAELQDSSGAELWVSEENADVVEKGGAGDPNLGPVRFLSYLSPLKYPAPRVDHRFTDGAVIRVGPIEVTAHHTPGHTPGCTSFSFPIRDGERLLKVVHRCSLETPPALSMGDYPEIVDDLERSFRKLRSLPVDIWLTAHGREFGRWRKFSSRDTLKDPVAPFIDPAGYLSSIDSAEMRFRDKMAKKEKK